MTVSGCAEAIWGPREYAYNEDRFYIRHVPMNASNRRVAEMASDRCAKLGKTAMLVDAEQYYKFDTRVAVYRCLAPGEDPSPGKQQPLPSDGGAPGSV